jgi:hypothetical protein
MTPVEAASALFASHDEYVKPLSWLLLHPLLSNLDRVQITLKELLSSVLRENGLEVFEHQMARNTHSAML